MQVKALITFNDKDVTRKPGEEFEVSEEWYGKIIESGIPLEKIETTKNKKRSTRAAKGDA